MRIKKQREKTGWEESRCLVRSSMTLKQLRCNDKINKNQNRFVDKNSTLYAKLKLPQYKAHRHHYEYQK